MGQTKEGNTMSNMVRYNDIQDEMIKGMVRGLIKAKANHDASVILNQYEGFKIKGWKEVVVNCPMLTHKVVVPTELFKTIADKMLGIFEGEEYNGGFGQLLKQMDAANEDIQRKMWNK